MVTTTHVSKLSSLITHKHPSSKALQPKRCNQSPTSHGKCGTISKNKQLLPITPLVKQLDTNFTTSFRNASLLPKVSIVSKNLVVSTKLGISPNIRFKGWLSLPSRKKWRFPSFPRCKVRYTVAKSSRIFLASDREKWSRMSCTFFRGRDVDTNFWEISNHVDEMMHFQYCEFCGSLASNVPVGNSIARCTG